MQALLRCRQAQTYVSKSIHLHYNDFTFRVHLLCSTVVISLESFTTNTGVSISANPNTHLNIKRYYQFSDSKVFFSIPYHSSKMQYCPSLIVSLFELIS